MLVNSMRLQEEALPVIGIYNQFTLSRADSFPYLGWAPPNQLEGLKSKV